MLLQTIKVKLFLLTGENKTNTGELMLIQQFIDFIKVDQFQLAHQTDAKPTQVHSLQITLVPSQTGDTQMSTGKLMLLDLLERKILSKEDQFQHAHQMDAIPTKLHTLQITP